MGDTTHAALFMRGGDGAGERCRCADASAGKAAAEAEAGKCHGTGGNSRAGGTG